MFVMESRIKCDEFQVLSSKFGFDEYQVVDYRGVGRERAGGLLLLWKEHISINILSWSLNHIGCSMVDDEDGQLWNLFYVYGHPKEQNKRKTWHLIQSLFKYYGNKALVFRDLNDILWENEKRGGNCRSRSQIEWDKNIVPSCGLVDLGYDGYPFTWMNRRRGSDNTQRRLDRALASHSFINRYNPIKVHQLSRFLSDHASISISLEAEPDQNCGRRKRVYRFHFEEA